MSVSQSNVVKSSSSSVHVSDGMGAGMGAGMIGAGGMAKGRQSGINTRTFLISRVDPTSRGSRSMAMSSRSSMSGGGMLSAGVAKQLSASGIAGFKDGRQKEKQELQALNERLASYIEKVHFLGAEVQRLEAENEALRNRKTEDLQPIRDAYENELAQARQVIDQMSVREGVAEAKVVGLNDEIARLHDLIATYETQAVDYRKKISALDAQIGDLEGELAALRARMGSRDDEGDKQRELIQKYQQQIANLRADLDSETTAHIEADCLAQTKTEEASFYKDLLDQLELMKPEPIKIKGMEASEFWQSNMKKAIREIQQSCDEKVDLIQQNSEANFASQMNAMQAGSVKDNMQLVNSKAEVSKLKGQLSEQKLLMAQLQSKIAQLQSERDMFASKNGELETQLDELRVKYDGQIASLEAELAGVMEQLKLFMDAKLTMDLEIAMYRKLLEGEETRSTFRSLVEHHLGGSSGGMALSGALSGEQGSASSSTGRMQVQRRSKGAVGFASIDHSGGSVIIENDRSHAQSRSVSLAGWKIQKKVNGGVIHEVNLNAVELAAGQSFTVWSKGAKQGAVGAFEQVAEAFSFGVGNCVWCLLDNSGDEKATLTATFM